MCQLNGDAGEPGLTLKSPGIVWLDWKPAERFTRRDDFTIKQPIIDMDAETLCLMNLSEVFYLGSSDAPLDCSLSPGL